MENIANIIAILISPAIAVLISIWIQREVDKKRRKEDLFKSLMEWRKSTYPSPAKVHALNMIDTVFADNKDIRKLWHEYYELLGEWGQKRDGKDQQIFDDRIKHKYFELIKEIAIDLHYKNFSELSLDKFYLPQGWEDELLYNIALRRELLRVLINTSDLVLTKRDITNLSDYDKKLREILLKTDNVDDQSPIKE